MRHRWILIVMASAVVAAGAKEPKPYQTAKLVQMNSVECGTSQKSDTSALGEIIGTDDKSMKSQEILCQEYVLRSDTLVYRIRPKDQKHPELLPVGSMAQFRIDKDKLMLRPAGDDKEREYLVVSMTPRDEADDAATQSQPSISGQAHPGRAH